MFPVSPGLLRVHSLPAELLGKPLGYSLGREGQGTELAINGPAE